MKFSNKVNCWFPGQSSTGILSLDPQSFWFIRVCKKKMQMRIIFTFLLLIAVLLQSFAAGPVTGRITDDKGSPLSGVTVQPGRGTAGVTTNSEGRYSITVAAGEDSLIFSYVGF